MTKLLKRLFFNKFRVKKLITNSKYSSLYEGINEKTNEPVAMKFEHKKSIHKLLENEAYYLYYLKGFGIPKLISYGKSGAFNILIEELLGKSIFQLWNLNNIKKEYKLKNVCMIALQILDRLEYIHSKDIIHKDIKPQNFIIGRKDPKALYLIDFGFSQKYRSSRTGKHIKFRFIKVIIGSLLYISINGIKGFQQSRKDDLESLGYMLIHLMTNSLPWINIYTSKIDCLQKVKKIFQMKKAILPEVLCKGLPEEFIQYMKYCRTLTFEQNPNYDYLKGLFTTILIKNQQNNDFNFFWIINNKKSKKEGENKDRRNIIPKRRESSQKRLYAKIKNSLEKMKSNISIVKKADTFNNLRNNRKDRLLNVKNINNDNDKLYNDVIYNIIKSTDDNEIEFIYRKNLFNSETKLNNGVYANKFNTMYIGNKTDLKNKNKFNVILTENDYENNNLSIENYKKNNISPINKINIIYSYRDRIDKKYYKKININNKKRDNENNDTNIGKINNLGINYINNINKINSDKNIKKNSPNNNFQNNNYYFCKQLNKKYEKNKVINIFNQSQDNNNKIINFYNIYKQNSLNYNKFNNTKLNKNIFNNNILDYNNSHSFNLRKNNTISEYNKSKLIY